MFPLTANELKDLLDFFEDIRNVTILLGGIAIVTTHADTYVIRVNPDDDFAALAQEYPDKITIAF